MKWFVLERTFSGGWKPAIYWSKEPPSTSTASGKRTFFKDPVQIAPEHLELSLKEINAIYGLPDKPAERRLHLS